MLPNLTCVLIYSLCCYFIVLFIFVRSITNSTNLDFQMWFQSGIISFNYSNFDIDNYSFFSLYEIVLGKSVNYNKLAVFKLYLTVHRCQARVQSLTCTTYGKNLRENIIAVLIPKLVILFPETNNKKANSYSVFILSFIAVRYCWDTLQFSLKKSLVLHLKKRGPPYWARINLMI